MPRTVLIVDDIEACAATLEVALSGVEGIELVSILGGVNAWRTIDAANEIAAIVTDLQMKGVDGFDLIERVRSHARHSAVPIIVVTGSPDPEAASRAIALGANACFAKPYSPAEVREKLQQLLSQPI